MSGFTYFINADVRGRNALEQLAKSAENADSAIDKIGASSESAGKRANSAFTGMSSSLKTLITTAAISATALSSLSNAADSTSLDNAIKFAGGKDGVENLAFVNKTIGDLNTPIASAKQGFKILSGGMMESGIVAEQQRKIYYSVAEAARVMGLSADDTTGAMIALGQIASKGTVQAEELKGQLGERLPGAFAIAARAMGMTQKELGKTMEKGNLMAKDFLPKFAAEMHKTFGPGLTSALDSPRAQFDKMQNSIYQLKNVLGNQLMPAATALINTALIPLFTWTGKNVDTILALGAGFGVWYATLKLATLWSGIYTATTTLAHGAQLLFAGSLGRSIAMAKIATFFTGGLTGAVASLSAAFWANPIMWVVGALGSLAVATVWAWNKFEGFRGFLVGTWEALKSFGDTLYNALILPFVSFGKMVYAVISGDKSSFEAAFDDWERSGRDAGNGAGQRIAESFSDGWNKGVKADKIDPMAMIGLGKETPLGSFFNVPATGGASALGGGGKDVNADKAKAMADGIAGGGGKNITINVQSLIQQLTVQSQTLKEGADQVGDTMIKTLLQVLNSANQTQTN